jgi:hypothetical protein
VRTAEPSFGSAIIDYNIEIVLADVECSEVEAAGVSQQVDFRRLHSMKMIKSSALILRATRGG